MQKDRIPAMRARATRPPTTAPAMTPVCDFFLWEVEDAGLSVLLAVLVEDDTRLGPAELNVELGDTGDRGPISKTKYLVGDRSR